MTDNQILTALAQCGDLPQYYAVQGFRNGSWATIFAPYSTAKDAVEMRNHLTERNPACRYQAIRIETVF